MDALEAGSKATTEPRKRKRSGLVKDGLAPGASDLPISVKTEPQTTPPVSQSGAPVSTTGETSPTPVKPMFNVNHYLATHFFFGNHKSIRC